MSVNTHQKAVHVPMTGGCLCEQVRYVVEFPLGSEFPPDPHTCQCTQCRKWSGSLVVHLLGIPRSNVNWSKKSTLQEYESTPGNFRGFCNACGTTFYWRSVHEQKDELEMTTGTLDQEVLLSDAGKALCIPTGGRFWCCREIKGVTDPAGFFGGGPYSDTTGKAFVEATALGKFM